VFHLKLIDRLGSRAEALRANSLRVGDDLVHSNLNGTTIKEQFTRSVFLASLGTTSVSATTITTLRTRRRIRIRLAGTRDLEFPITSS